MGWRNRLSSFGEGVIEELQIAAGTPEPKSVDKHMATAHSGRAEQHIPDKKQLERYWNLYKNVSIIRNPIRSFASEVIAPGYYVETENEDLKEDLESWLENSAIVDGDIDKDFRHLLKKAAVQREVKGTALVEKVKNEDGKMYGFKLMRPETVRAFTIPGQTVLLPPDADVEKDSEGNGMFRGRQAYTTADGDAAAYVQITSHIRGYSGDTQGYVPFTRDQVIKLTRDTDAGEVFGTSRLASVEDRVESLLKKLDDNDRAIESSAHPYMLFKAGLAEDPWPPEKVEALAKEHRQDRYEPGLKQFVQGDLDLDTYTGEVADIEPYLNWDLNAIMSDMPMPKYSLGAFESDVNQFVSRSQSARLERQVNDARQEIQDEWTAVIREKAEELGYDEEEVEGLVIGEDPADLGIMMDEDGNIVPEDDVQEGNIPEGNNSNETNVGSDGTNYTRPPASTEPNRDGGGETVNGDQ